MQLIAIQHRAMTHCRRNKWWLISDFCSDHAMTQCEIKQVWPSSSLTTRLTVAKRKLSPWINVPAISEQHSDPVRNTWVQLLPLHPILFSPWSIMLSVPLHFHFFTNYSAIGKMHNHVLVLHSLSFWNSFLPSVRLAGFFPRYTKGHSSWSFKRSCLRN